MLNTNTNPFAGLLGPTPPAPRTWPERHRRIHEVMLSEPNQGQRPYRKDLRETSDWEKPTGKAAQDDSIYATLDSRMKYARRRLKAVEGDPVKTEKAEAKLTQAEELMRQRKTEMRALGFRVKL